MIGGAPFRQMPFDRGMFDRNVLFGRPTVKQVG